VDIYIIVQVKKQSGISSYFYESYLYKLGRNQQGDPCWIIHETMFHLSRHEIPASDFEGEGYPYFGVVEDVNPIPFKEEHLKCDTQEPELPIK